MKNIYQINVLSNFIEYADLIKLDELLDKYKNGTDSFEPQDFIGEHLKKEYQWVTAISLIEASEMIVEEAIKNGNIKKERA